MQKKNNGKTVLTIIILLGIITAAIYFSVRAGVFTKPSTNNAVRLEVDSDGGYAIITYTVGEESSNGTITVNTPWKKNFNAEDGASVFLTAGNPSQSGEVSCLISLNGRDWKSDTVDYPKQAVACGGIIPHK